SGICPPGPGGYIEGTSPYFFSVSQSAGPIRSNPLQPHRAASRQQSSSDMLRANTPPVTACLSRPLRGIDCADPVLLAFIATAPTARADINSRRFMIVISCLTEALFPA